MEIDRVSQLLPYEREALIRALFTVFDRPDCRGRALSLPELPPLLAQAGFDASRCSLPLLEDALWFCGDCHFFDSLEGRRDPGGSILFAAKGLTPFGRWRAAGKTTLTFVGFNRRSLLFDATILAFLFLFLRLL